MSRKPREHGWLTSDGVTHTIDTRRPYAYEVDTRVASCGTRLWGARRVKMGLVDCMACIRVGMTRVRLPPMPPPSPRVRSWTTRDGVRHVARVDEWTSLCGVSLRAFGRESSEVPTCTWCIRITR